MRCVRPPHGRHPQGMGGKIVSPAKWCSSLCTPTMVQSLAQRAFQCSSRGVHVVSWTSALQHKSIGCSISMSVTGRNPPTASRAVHVFWQDTRFRISADDLLCRSRGRWGPNFNVDEQLSLSVVLALAYSANVTQSHPAGVHGWLQVAAIETAVSETVIFASSACDFNIGNFGPYGDADRTFCQ